VLVIIEIYIIRLLTMKLFTKSLFAAAMLAGVAGGAQASLSAGNNDAEAFLQVYDATQGLTYDLDLGLTLSSIFNTQLNPSAISVDLSADPKWVTFTSNLDPTNTKYGVVAGYNLKAAWTSLTEPNPPKAGAFQQITTAIKNQAFTINSGLPQDTTQNVSKLVYDTDAAKSGQWALGSAPGINTLATLFGTYSVGGADASIPFGAEAPFYTLTSAGIKNLSPFVWSVSGSSLTFNTPTAPVPLPAAVWMFGAGLLGMLGLNRRKVTA